MDATPFGHYQLLELLGRGGMGQVFRAHDTVTDRIVALKVLPSHLAGDPVFQQRFRREAHAAAGLSDPHVVPIHGYGEIDGQLYLDMRLIDGKDLGTVLSEAAGPLTPERAVTIVEQVAAALDAAHAVDLVHRDVKPSNIFVAARDFVYLIDFGIARTTSQTGLTSVGSTLGTMAYMAPERFKSGQSDPRSDVYALTCVLHECLTGQRPYSGDSLEQQLAGHLVTPPPRPSATNPALPKGFDDVIAKGMAKEPDQRYQTAGELAEAARAVQPVRRAAHSKPHPLRTRHPRRLSTLALSSAALVGVIIAALVTWQMRSASNDSEWHNASSTARSTTSGPSETSPAPALGDPAAIAATVPAAIRATGKLVVGINEPYTPAEFRDADGNLTGFDVDLMNAVARTLGLEVEYRETAFESIIPSVQGNAFNVGLSSFTDTKEREASVDFVTYFQAGTQWAQRAGDDGESEQCMRATGRRALPDHPGHRGASREEQGLRRGGLATDRRDRLRQPGRRHGRADRGRRRRHVGRFAGDGLRREPERRRPRAGRRDLRRRAVRLAGRQGVTVGRVAPAGRDAPDRHRRIPHDHDQLGCRGGDDQPTGDQRRVQLIDGATACGLSPVDARGVLALLSHQRGVGLHDDVTVLVGADVSGDDDVGTEALVDGMDVHPGPELVTGPHRPAKRNRWSTCTICMVSRPTSYSRTFSRPTTKWSG